MILTLVAGALIIVALATMLALALRRLDEAQAEVARLRRRLEGDLLPDPVGELLRFPADRPQKLPPLSGKALAAQSARTLAALALIALPYAENAASVAAAAIASTGVLVSLAVLALSRRDAWWTVGYAALAGASFWAIWALFAAQRPGAAPLLAFVFAAAGALALLHAVTAPRRLAAQLIAAVMAASCLALAWGPTASLWGLVGLGALVTLAAGLGAVAARFETLHLAAWIFACAGLWVLSGSGAAALIWFTPAAAWTGALFAGVAAVCAPLLKRQGAVVATTGAVTPILSAVTIHAVAAPPNLAIAAALLLAAATSAGILALSAQRVGGLRLLGMAALPPMLCAPAASALGAVIGFPGVLAVTPLALLALVLLGADRLFPHPLWRGMAAAAAMAALVALAWGAHAALAAGGPTALTAIALGFAVPALLASIAYAMIWKGRVWTRAAAETFAFALTAASCFLAIRWLATGADPLNGAYGFGEMGAHAALWLILALLLITRPHAGLFHSAASALLGGAALAALILGPLGVLNPLWGAWREPVAGLPLLNQMASGFGAPALAAAVHALVWTRLKARPAALVASLGAIALVLIWAGLETRRLFHGPELDQGPIAAAEMMSLIALGAIALGAALALYFTRSSTISSGRPARQGPSLGPAARK